MKIILQPYQTIRLASLTVGIPPHALRRGCRSGQISHIRHNGRIYIDMVALLGKLSTDQQGGCGEEG